MDKPAIIQGFKQKHQEFGEFIDSLSKIDFERNRNTKWSAEQELDHILKSLQPLSDILPNKEFIATKFGKGDGISDNYETLVNRYKTKLEKGGKAFGPFVPETVNWHKKADLLHRLNLLTKEIYQNIQQYSEQELNELRLPHPLLGLLTVKEMLYFTNYHVVHHLSNAKQNLKSTIL